MTYVLIIFMWWSNNGGSMTSAEFSTLDKCQKAGADAKAFEGMTGHLSYICKEK